MNYINKTGTVLYKSISLSPNACYNVLKNRKKSYNARGSFYITSATQSRMYGILGVYVELLDKLYVVATSAGVTTAISTRLPYDFHK